MLALDKKFAIVKEKDKDHGDYIILCGCAAKQGYSEAQIKDAFKKCVKDEKYGKRDREELIAYLILQTNRPK